MYTSPWGEFSSASSTDMSNRTEIISERMEYGGSEHFHELAALPTNVTEKSVINESYVLIENATIIPMEYIFDRADIRGIFITLYTLVFCCCFFGNLLVILVVTLSRRLRSITNFFLANLALADFCVGVFCVFQNLSIYLMPSWVFGDFLCKMYQFIHSLSYTASIFILVVICTERYFAIIHPITCKQILTPTRLRMVIIGVWITSAIYSAPKFVWVQTITNALADGQLETICISHRKKYDSEVFDMINFALLYVAPLCVMTLLYTRIAVALWRSSRSIERVAMTKAASTPSTPCIAQDCSHHFAPVDTQVTNDSGSSSTHVITTTWRSRIGGNSNNTHLGHLSQNVLRARRGVIRMLIVVVLTFAVCNLPFHARKMWQYWSANYQGGSNFSTLFTPLTFLITYFNSGINPFLYAFLSRNFRKGTRELIYCSCKGKKKQSSNLLSNQQSGNQQISMLRRSSTRSTRAPCSSVTHATNGDDT